MSAYPKARCGDCGLLQPVDAMDRCGDDDGCGCHRLICWDRDECEERMELAAALDEPQVAP